MARQNTDVDAALIIPVDHQGERIWIATGRFKDRR
jgi:hypothetical protein